MRWCLAGELVYVSRSLALSPLFSFRLPPSSGSKAMRWQRRRADFSYALAASPLALFVVQFVRSLCSARLDSTLLCSARRRRSARLGSACLLACCLLLLSAPPALSRAEPAIAACRTQLARAARACCWRRRLRRRRRQQTEGRVRGKAHRMRNFASARHTKRRLSCA